MARIDTKIDCHSFCVTGITEYGTRRKGWLSFNHTSKYLLVLASTCYLYQFCYPLLLTEMLFREFVLLKSVGTLRQCQL